MTRDKFQNFEGLDVSKNTDEKSSIQPRSQHIEKDTESKIIFATSDVRQSYRRGSLATPVGLNNNLSQGESQNQEGMLVAPTLDMNQINMHIPLRKIKKYDSKIIHT